ncbi:putative EF-hand domain-containing protein [Helianthus anomalus]
MAERLTEDQISEFRQAFSMIDKDSDGLISTDDLIGVIQTLNEHATNEEVQEMMHEVDANEEGTIDFHEFLSIMSKRMKVST